MIKSTPADKVDFTNFSGLPEFYKQLGWNPDLFTLDPKKVSVNPQDAIDIMDKYLNVKTHSREEMNLIWLNYGPRSNPKVARGTVKLHKGWLYTQEEKEA